MSANNQILVKEHKGKWYVFTNVMAESWCSCDGKIEHGSPEDKINELNVKYASAVCNSRDEAYEKALELEQKELEEDGIGTEYGVQFNRLCKDDAEVKIID